MKKTLVSLMVFTIFYADFTYAKYLEIRNRTDKKILVLKENGARRYISPNSSIQMELRVGERVENWIGSDKMCEWIIPSDNVHYNVVGLTYGRDGKEFDCTVDMRANDLP